MKVIVVIKAGQRKFRLENVTKVEVIKRMSKFKVSVPQINLFLLRVLFKLCFVLNKELFFQFLQFSAIIIWCFFFFFFFELIK